MTQIRRVSDEGEEESSEIRFLVEESTRESTGVIDLQMLGGDCKVKKERT